MALAELDLVDLYFRTTEDVIDRWVICESPRSFTYLEKPLHIWNNRARYARWWDRVIHVLADDVPANITKEKRDEWNRSQLARGYLPHIHPSDVLVIGDLDEIPRPEVVAAYKPGTGIRNLQMRNYYFYINVQAKTLPWERTVICSGSHVMTGWTPVKLRYTEFPIIPDAGWHFSSTGGPDALAYKLKSFAHAGMGHEDAMVQSVRDGTWIDNVHPTPLDVVPIDGTYPAPVRDYPELMKEWGLVYEGRKAPVCSPA